MANRRMQLKRLLKCSNWALVFFCLSMYAMDLTIGDGDGVMEKWKLNPLKVFLVGQILILLLLGIANSGKRLSNICLAVLSVLVALFLSGILLKKLKLGLETTHQWIKPLDERFPYTKYDTVYFKNYVPGSVFQYQAMEKDGGKRILVKINSDGVRGPEIEEKKGYENRILFLGDSFIQALQVDFRQTAGQVLERMAADTVKVIQHGFPSWSPLLEWNWLIEKGMSFKPDKVVLFLFYNDFFSGNSVGDAGYTPYTVFDEMDFPAGFQFEEAKTKPARNPWNLMLRDFRNIQLHRWIRFQKRKKAARRQIPKQEIKTHLEMPADLFEKARSSRNTNSDPLISLPWDLAALMRDTIRWDKHVEQRVKLSFGYLKTMQSYLASRDIGLYITLIPHPWHFRAGVVTNRTSLGWEEVVFARSGLQDAVERFCYEQDIPFIDLYDRFSKFEDTYPDRALYFPLDGHWTETGHKLVAETVYEYINDVR